MRALKRSDRSRVLVFLIVSLLMLSAAIALRATTPLPFAPRVRVRWTTAIEDGQRAALERQLRLVRGERREGETWEYDLVDPSPASVAALVEHPGVADTHYIERSAGRIASDAPQGTIRLPEGPAATVLHSIVFDWFLLFCVSSSVVSGVWLASGAAARD